MTDSCVNLDTISFGGCLVFDKVIGFFVKGNAQFVQDATFGPLRKNDRSSLKYVLENTNDHTCNYLRYVTLVMCLR